MRLCNKQLSVLTRSDTVGAVLALVQDMVGHKWHANAALLAGIQQHAPAAHDEELRKLLHHILVANRFWLALSLQHPFDFENEARVPDSLDIVISSYRETAARELEWIRQVQPQDLSRQLHSPFFQNHSFSVAEGVTQICLHSHGHRAQCSMRLRALGATPPNTDYILWVKDRPSPEWPL